MSKRTQIVLSTYPRSGSVFFKRLISLNAANFSKLKKGDFIFDFKKTHSLDNNADLLVTIARNPLDSIVSNTTMMMHYNNANTISEALTFALKQYCESYKFFIENANVVILFDDLTNNPEAVIKNFLSIFFKINDYDKILISIEIDDMKEEGHLSTSKRSEYYDRVLEACSSLDLSYANLLFNQLVSKAKDVVVK